MLKKIIINSENRRFNISSIAIGYLDENKVEQIEFEIPEQYKNYGKKACFSANGTTFAKLFDDITSNILTITRDISQYNELDLSIEFFKAENEDEIIARTSILHIVIENAIVCEDVKPDDKKVVILNELIEKVTSLQQETTENEEIREENEQNRIKNEEERILYYENIKEKVENGDFNGKDALINGVNTLEIIEGDNIHLEQQANVLTISNTYDDSKLKEDIQKNETNINNNSQEITNVKENLKNYSLITETGNKISLTINSSTYVMTLQLKDKNGSVLSTGTIDLPLETMVVGASYNADTQEIELTLKNGSKVSFSVSDLVKGLVNEDDLNDTLQDYALKTSIPTKLSQLTEDSTHRLVTDTEKATWNNKVDKVEGKGLSTNDFTNELKSKLDGIEDNAQVNKIEKISLDGVEQEINEKEVNIKSYDINKYFYNALTYNEAKGNDLTFEDSIEFPLGKLDMDGKSEQVTTTGIQMFNPDTEYPISKAGLTITKEDDGAIVINGTSTDNMNFNLTTGYSQEEQEQMNGKTYTIVVNTSGTGTLNNAGLKYAGNSNRITISDIEGNNNYNKTSIYTKRETDTVSELTFTIYALSGVTFNNMKLYFNLYEGEYSEDKVYEPYTGGQPSPSPDYPQEINSIKGDLEFYNYGSKNIFDENWTQGYFTGNLGETNTSNIGGRGTNKYYIGTNKKAYVLFNVKKNIMLGRCWLQQFDKDKNSIVRSTTGIYDTQLNVGFHSYEINLDENTRYVSLSFYSINDGDTAINFANFKDYIDNVSISTTSIEYEPYKGRTLTIPTNGQVFRKVGDVADKLVIDMKTGDYYKQGNIGEIILNGSEYFSMTYGTGMFVTSSYYKGMVYEAISDKFIYNKVQSGIYNKLKDLQFAVQRYGSHSNFFIKYMKYDNVDSFKEWLKENNATFLCQLGTPTLEKLGTLTKEQLDMLVTFKGYNNLMINTNLGQADIDIEYVLDMKKYIDNKIAEISAQLI